MKVLFLILTLLMLGCSSDEQKIKWKGRCFPYEFLSEASFITSNNGDTSFDGEVSDAPILFFTADYVMTHIQNFQAFEYQENSQYNHFLSVNFSPSRKLDLDVDDTRFKIFSDTKDLYITKDYEKSHFDLYTKTTNGFLYWGFCNYSAVDAYNCFRSIEFGNSNINYLVHKDNISTYRKIDAFIFEHLDKWRCE